MYIGYLIGIGAGFASAVMYASGGSGPLAVMALLNLLTALPLFLAGLGWGAAAGTVAAVAGSAALIPLVAPQVAVVYALTYAMPAALLGFLCLLHRTRKPAGGDAVQRTSAPPIPATADWFPVGRILAIAASLACLFSLAAVRARWLDGETERREIRAFLDKNFAEQFQAVTGRALGAAELDELVGLFYHAIPALTAMLWLSVMLFNLWLAGRITRASGTLIRPWPDLAETRLPLLFPFVFAGIVALLFLKEPFPAMASGPLGAFLLAYLLIGLAVLHFVTRNTRLRTLILGVTYAGMLVLPQVFTVLAVLLGLGEPVLRLRNQRRTPPDNPPKPPAVST